MPLHVEPSGPPKDAANQATACMSTPAQLATGELLGEASSTRRANPPSRLGKTRIPRPFLKWVGGKTQALAELVTEVDKVSPFGTYHEPFLGGGALYFELFRTLRLPNTAVLSDVNPNLIDCYEAVQHSVTSLISKLELHKQEHSTEHYYAVRSAVPESLIGRAARVIYLNKTCFNGLYRENSRGEFNVPIGDYANPAICDPDNLLACSGALAAASVHRQPFAAVLDTAIEGDLVYFDPPYVPLSTTSSFTSYARDGFGLSDQQHLADVARELDRRGVFVILSNSSTPLVEDLYRGFRLREILAVRAVNSKGDGRGRVREIVATNFD